MTRRPSLIALYTTAPSTGSKCIWSADATPACRSLTKRLTCERVKLFTPKIPINTVVRVSVSLQNNRDLHTAITGRIRVNGLQFICFASLNTREELKFIHAHLKVLE